jgi:hypothetical protein
LAWALSLGTALAHALGIKWVVAVTGAVWMQVGTLCTAFSIGSWTLAPEIPWLPAGPLQGVALVLGGLYALKTLNRSVSAIGDRLDS